jgi:DNA-binding transcriptional MerR regulator
MTKSKLIASGYRIGTVSRMTGISPDTLRIWERRYDVVTPQRSAGGGRLYSSEDVARLKLIGRLVDKGDAISVVAGLSQEELERRIEETHTEVQTSPLDVPFRLVVIGELLTAKMRAAEDALVSVDLVACFDSPQAFLVNANSVDADILLVELPSLQSETAVQIVDWLARINAAHVVVIYRFAAQQALQQLPRSRCSSLRAPVDADTVQRHCLAVLGRHQSPSSEEVGFEVDQGRPVPPRQYSDEELARLAGISSTIKCECPRHLAELVASLSAFESYSAECESRNLEDAELHAYLSATTSQARHLFEVALSRVIEAEGIEL